MKDLFGTGDFIYVLVERGFVHSEDTTSSEDVALLRFIAQLNEIMPDSDVVKPNWTVTCFTGDDRGKVFYRHRHAIMSARTRKSDPAQARPYPRSART